MLNICEDYVQVGSNRVFHRHGGEGSPVILLHGFGASSFSWRANIPTLAQRFRVFAPDQLGFGQSDKPNDDQYSAAKRAQFIVQYMDLLGIDRADLVGNSMGGMVALQVALDAPERVNRLVLIDSAGLERSGPPPWGRVFAWAPLLRLYARWKLRDLAFIKRLLSSAFFDPTLVSDEVLQGYAQPLITDEFIEGLIAMMHSSHGGSIAHRLSEIHHPTLVIWGAEDKWIPVDHAARLNALLPNSQLEIIPGAGHVPHEERWHVVNEMIIDFLRASSKPEN